MVSQRLHSVTEVTIIIGCPGNHIFLPSGHNYYATHAIFWKSGANHIPSWCIPQTINYNNIPVKMFGQIKWNKKNLFKQIYVSFA
jgi:hypothetical protein